MPAIHELPPGTLPDLPLVRARVSFRLLADTALPGYKGALLRGGFGYAFQRISCPQTCWERAEHCPTGTTICPYRAVFAPPHPPGVAHFHDLQDVPRPFVIEPPQQQQEHFAAGDALEFQLLLFGRGIDHLPAFLFGFENFGRAGLGRQRAQARLERVEALAPFGPTGTVIYQDGKPINQPDLPLINLTELPAHAARLPADLRMTLLTPLRLKSGGRFIEQIDLPAIVQAISWRMSALSAFHGAGPWEGDFRPLLAAARSVRVEAESVRWVDWERTSTHGARQTMKLGGIVGSVVLRDVPPQLRTLLLIGSLIHVGKACVFGHGRISLAYL